MMGSDSMVTMSAGEFQAAIKNAEQDGRIIAIEKSMADSKDASDKIWAAMAKTNDLIDGLSRNLAKEYATMAHVEKVVTNAVKNERLLVRVAIWGIGLVLFVAAPMISYFVMDKLDDINEHLEISQEFQRKIELHLLDSGAHSHNER